MWTPESYEAPLYVVSMNKNAMLMIIIHEPNPLGLKICQAERLKT